MCSKEMQGQRLEKQVPRGPLLATCIIPIGQALNKLLFDPQQEDGLSFGLAYERWTRLGEGITTQAFIGDSSIKEESLAELCQE